MVAPKAGPAKQTVRPHHSDAFTIRPGVESRKHYAVIEGAHILRKPRRVRPGSLLYLPPYSPDLNPIEQLFAKLKALPRKAAARTKDALWTAIGHLIDAFEPNECRNYIRNCGYDPV